MVCTAAWAAILGVMSAHTRRAWLTHPDWGAPVGVVESVIRRHYQSLLDALCARFLIHTDHPTRRQQQLFLHLLGDPGLPRQVLESNLPGMDWEKSVADPPGPRDPGTEPNGGVGYDSPTPRRGHRPNERRPGTSDVLPGPGGGP